MFVIFIIATALDGISHKFPIRFKSDECAEKFATL